MPQSTSVRQEETALPGQFLGTPPSILKHLPRSYRHWLRGEFPEEADASAEALAEFLGGRDTRTFQRFLNCRTQAWFMRHRETGQVTVHSNACRVRGCPFCARSLALQIAHNLTSWIRRIRGPKHLILTLIHNDRPLPEQIDHLYQSFARMRRYKRWQRTVKGGVWFAQVTRNQKKQEWHVHAHCLVDAFFYPQSALCADWAKATGDSHNTFVTEIKDTAQAVRDASRYVARPGWLHTLTRPQRLDVLAAFAGRRLCGCWGVARDQHVLTIEKLDRDAWENLGAFNHVVGFVANDPDAASIYLAWQTGAMLDIDISLHDLSAAIDSPVTFQPRAPPQPQTSLLWGPGSLRKQQHADKIHLADHPKNSI